MGRMMTDESIKTSVLCMGARTTTSNASAAVVPTSLEELRRLALQMGCVLEPISKWARTVAHSVATALRTREGDFIYQSAALRIVEMPRDAAVAIFPTPKRSSPQEMYWELTSASETAAFFQNLLPLSGMQTAGATRAIQRPSEPVIRVMATMMGGVEIRHTTSRNGSNLLTINFLYVLTGEMGDLHPPKDPERREIALSSEEETELRQLVLTDAKALGNKGAQLSAGWWRQLGDEIHAQVAESHLANLEAMRGAAPQAGTRRIATRDTYEVSAILGVKKRGWLRVAWEGYHPAWEAWRKEGEVGSQVITWEPRRKVKHTIAYQEWLERMERAA